MVRDSGVNPVTVSAELSVESETVGRYREPPPPYSAANADPVVTQQPVVHQTIVVQGPLKNGPIFYNCPVCHERILTSVKYVSTQKTHMLAGFIAGFTCWCMLCCLAAVPYLIPTCKKTEHYCPNCDTFLGNYSKL